MIRPSHFPLRAALFAVAALGSALPAAHAATFSVSNLNDSGAGSLRAAIVSANASAGADVVDAKTLGGTINLASSLPPLQSTLSIQGAGANTLTIKRASSATFRVFTVNAGATISLLGLQLSGGGGGLETGGAIANGGALSLSNCTLSGNAARRGGALFSTGTVSVESCTFSNNSAVGGGAIATSNGFLTVAASTFDANTASNDGGALLLSQTRTLLARSTFSNNRAGDASRGGALYWTGFFDLSRAAVAVENCTFAGNRAGTGGALAVSGGALQLQNATVTDNLAASGAGLWSDGNAQTLTFVASSIVAGNSGLSSSVGSDADSGGSKNTFVSRGFNLVGGGNSTSSFNKTGDKTRLTRDQLMIGALAANGGPTKTILPRATSPAVDAIPLASLGVAVDQRGTARPQGKAGDIGSVEIVAAPSSVTLVVNNTSDSDDGACSSAPNGCTLREAINSANALSASGSTQTTNITFDPTVFATAQTIVVGQAPDFNSYFSTALVVTGRMKIVGPGANLLSVSGAGAVRQFLVSASANVSISGITLSQGRPFRGRGGAILSSGTLELSGCALRDNIAEGGAGGAVLNSGTLSLRSCTVSNNSIRTLGLDSSGTGNEHSFGGGGIYNSGTLLVSGSTIYGNVASLNCQGGGIYNVGTATIESSTVASNSTDAKGGGICSQSTGLLTVTSCTLSGNVASNFNNTSFGAGGGIHADGPLVLRNSTVAGNRVENDLRSSGGGVWTNATASIENCTITANDSHFNPAGGVLVYGGTTTIKNSVIAANVNNTVYPDVLAFNSTILARRSSRVLSTSTVSNGATIVSGGYNFIGYADSPSTFSAPGDRAGGSLSSSSPALTVLDPRLGTLANNGGSVQTIAPLPDSPLINAGDPSFNASTLPFDERGPGFPRVVGGRLDIGAFETQNTLAISSKTRSSAGSS